MSKPTLANQFHSNLSDTDRDAMITEASSHFEKFLQTVGIDTNNDHNTNGTARRFAKMFVNELSEGRFINPPVITAFENASKYNDLITVGPLPVLSCCSHHIMPIQGSAFVSVLPDRDGKVIGLSKYARIVEYFSRRPQIQEELTRQILDHIVGETENENVAVLIEASHMCMSHRGACASGVMRTSALGGDFLTEESLKREFMDFVNSKVGPQFRSF